MPEHPDNPAPSPRRPPPAASPCAEPPVEAAWVGVEPATVVENLALDEALLELAHEGVCGTACVRTWMAAEPTVVLGSSGRRDEEVDLVACARHGVRVLRRPSGGGTVLLGPGCLMWSVIVPHPGGPPPIESIHAAMLEPLAAALTAEMMPRPAAGGLEGAWVVARHGTSDLAVVPSAAVVGPNAPERGLAAYASARKVSGNALRVRRHGVLYHGTLLDSFDIGLVSQVLRHPPREPGYRGGRRHDAFLANLGLGRETLERVVRTAFHATRREDSFPRDRVARLVRERYAAADWTERL